MNNVIPMYANNVLLRTEHLTKLYTDGQVSALLDVSVEIHHGEYVSIMGPSGSGKSTLLNLLGALDSPTSGELYFEGKPLSSIRNLNKLRRRSSASSSSRSTSCPCSRPWKTCRFPCSRAAGSRPPAA